MNYAVHKQVDMVFVTIYNHQEAEVMDRENPTDGFVYPNCE